MNEAVDRYFLPEGYLASTSPELDDHDAISRTDVLWQADVYRLAFWIARGMGATTIVDVGSGHGEKLVSFASDFQVVGIDTEENARWCRNHYTFGQWISADLERPLPELTPSTVNAAFVVCADVIEHLVNPLPLLREVGKWLSDGACALLLSTPDRVLVRGGADMGPPANPNHVREWAAGEFARLLEAVELAPLLVGHVPPNNAASARSSVLALITAQDRSRFRRRRE